MLTRCRVWLHRHLHPRRRVQVRCRRQENTQPSVAFFFTTFLQFPPYKVTGPPRPHQAQTKPGCTECSDGHTLLLKLTLLIPTRRSRLAPLAPLIFVSLDTTAYNSSPGMRASAIQGNDQRPLYTHILLLARHIILNGPYFCLFLLRLHLVLPLLLHL